MTTPQADRPARTRPVPAADAGVDPIDYGTRPAAAPRVPVEAQSVTAPAVAPERAAAAPQPSPAAQPPAIAPVGGIEVTVQLSTRVSPDVNDVLTQAKQRTGKNKRALIEEAIMKTWAV